MPKKAKPAVINPVAPSAVKSTIPEPPKMEKPKKAKKAPSAYNKFVAEHYQSAKGSSFKEKMAEVAKAWKASKTA